MAVKHFCDVCGDELTSKNWPDTNNHRLMGYANPIRIEVVTGSSINSSNTGDFCVFCIKKAVDRVYATFLRDVKTAEEKACGSSSR